MEPISYVMSMAVFRAYGNSKDADKPVKLYYHIYHIYSADLIQEGQLSVSGTILVNCLED